MLDTVIRRALEMRYPATTFVWSGGEPTLAGVEFFYRAVSAQQRFGANGQVVCNAFQTNGLLLDAAWGRFLFRYRFLVGLSLDGPQEIHDLHRRTCGGSPSWPAAMRAVRLLQDFEVPFSVLCVVTHHTAGMASALYHFFRTLGTRSVQFLPCFTLEGRCFSQHFPSISPDEWGQFLCDLFDAWWESPQTAIPYFDALLHTFLGLPSPECTLRDQCDAYLAVDADGSVYPCDFCMTAEWRLGSIATDSWPALLRHPARQRFLSLKPGWQATCRSCEWFAHCRSGCPRHRPLHPAPSSLPAWCESTRRLLAHAAPRMEALARQYRHASGQEPRQEIHA